MTENKLMNEQEFYSFVKANLKNYLPESLEDGVVELRDYRKNNDVLHKSLTITKEGENVVPNLYLNGFYEDYMDGTLIGDVMYSIGDEYERACQVERPNPENMDFSYEAMKGNIVFQVVEISRNRDRLKDMEFEPIGNGLAKTYAVRLPADVGESRIMVTRDFVRANNWDMALVRTDADINTPKIMKPTLIDMEASIFGRGGDANLLENPQDAGEASMYILTNDNFTQGSASLFYPDVQSKVAEVVGGDYFALPSSIHEFIILPDDGEHSVKDLGNMVKDANATVVEPQDILSDKVYHFDAERGELSIARDDKAKSREEAR